MRYGASHWYWLPALSRTSQSSSTGLEDCDVGSWHSASVRCDAAIRPEAEVARTRHRRIDPSLDAHPIVMEDAGHRRGTGFREHLGLHRRIHIMVVAKRS